MFFLAEPINLRYTTHISRRHSKRNSAMPYEPPDSPTIDDDDFSDEGTSQERLQKVLASAGIGSRRQCEDYIRDGRVTVDGNAATELGIKVDPLAQKVCVDGERIKFQKKQYFIVNKPIGVVCTNADPQGRPRVVDLLPPWHCQFQALVSLQPLQPQPLHV